MLNHVLLKKYLHEKSNDLIIIRMFLAFGTAIFWITPALFLKFHGFSDSLIGFILAITAFASLIISVVSTIILEKFNEYKLFLFSIFIPLVFLFILIFYPLISVYILFLVIATIFKTVRGNSFSIIFKDITKNRDFSRKESLMYSFLNIGWFVGPFMGGLLIENYGFVETFALAAFFYLIALSISLILKIKLKRKWRIGVDGDLIKNIKFYFHQKELIKAYLLSLSSSVWYVLIFIFVPLFIIEEGLGEAWVGIFIALTQFPLIFIQFKLNYFIQKFGMKKLIIYAYSYLSLLTLILFFYSEIYFTIIFLATSSLALGFIEPLREIYFFKNVRAVNEEKTYPIFYTSFSVGDILGKIILAGVLLILPKNFTYLAISILMALAIFISLSLKNHKK
jgi:predicted MFS family arabinose efflux permease